MAGAIPDKQHFIEVGAAACTQHLEFTQGDLRLGVGHDAHCVDVLCVLRRAQALRRAVRWFVP